MKASTLLSLKHGLILLALFACSLLQAQATLSVQGVITKADGTAVDDGTYSLVFRLWKSPTTNAPADKVHEETLIVETTGGVYSTVLGESTPLMAPFDQVYFLGVTLGSAELLPRPQLTHAPYALSLLGQSNQFPSTGPVTADAMNVVGAISAGSYGVVNASSVTAAGAVNADAVQANTVNATAMIASGGAPAAANLAGVGYAFGAGGDGDGGLFSSGDNNVALYANATKVLEGRSDRLQLFGKVLISDNAPNVQDYSAKLTINDDILYDGLNKSGNFLANAGGIGFGTLTSGSTSISIYASSMVAGSAFLAHSDARIKRIVGRSNGAGDLNLLRQIQVTDYTFIDQLARGNRVSKKVIAQEVEAVYPEAVTTTTGVVPDIYQTATIKAGRVELNNNLKPGERVQLIFGSAKHIAEVLAADTSGFRVALEQEGPVFVYGRYVNDFRTVDYEALSMLNISATQELVRRLEQLETENAALKAKQNASAQLLEDVAGRLKALEARAGLNGSK